MLCICTQNKVVLCVHLIIAKGRKPSWDHLSALSSDERNVHIQRYGNVILAYA